MKEVVGKKNPQQFRKQKEFFHSNLEAVMSCKTKNVFHKNSLIAKCYEVVCLGKYVPMFGDNILPPSSDFKNRHEE